MTYNRMEAKPIAGEHCRFCGDAQAPLVKTKSIFSVVRADDSVFAHETLTYDGKDELN
jgi:hypothetical protein